MRVRGGFVEYHALLFIKKLQFKRELSRAQVGQGVYIYFLLYGLSLCSKSKWTEWTGGKNILQLSQNRTYENFFASWSEKGCRKVMSRFLSKKVENSCIGTTKGNNNDVIYTCKLEKISQPSYSPYMDQVSNDITNNFGKMPLVMLLLTTGEDCQTCYYVYM